MTYWLRSSPALLLLLWLLLSRHDRRCLMTSSSDWQWLTSGWAELDNKDMNVDHLRASRCRTDVFYDCAVFVYLLTLLILPKPSQFIQPGAWWDASSSLYKQALEECQGIRAHSALSQVMSFGYFGRSKKTTSIANLDIFQSSTLCFYI